MTFSTLWTGLVWIWTASEIVIGLATRTRRGQGKVQDRGSQILLWIVIINSVTGCEWTRHTISWAVFGNSSWMTPLSLLLLASGLGIRWAAILTLGKSFSANVAIRATQRVKKTGLYRFARHPSYLGLLLIFAAIGVHSRNWVSLAIVLVPTTLALLYRIRIEEAALNQAFGPEYADYSRLTKKLIPGLY